MIVRCEGRDVVFLDVEASSLDAGSFPVEFGWVLDDERPSGALIRPHPAWDADGGWSASSQKLHGIALDDLLRHGLDVGDACRRLDEACRGRLAVSDNPAFEEYWVSMAFEAAGLVREWTISHVDAVYRSICREAGLAAVDVASAFMAVDRAFPHIHRAAPDALRMAKRARSLVDPVFRTALRGAA